MFNITDLARITAAGQSVAPALWAYGTADTFATATGSGYFNTIAANLNVGDIIFILASDSNLAVQVTAVTPNVTVQVIGNYQGALANGTIFVGNASNVATSVTPSGDLTMSNTGVFTIGKVLDGDNPANTVDGNTHGALPVLYAIAVAGGSTANYDITLVNKIMVIDAWVQLNGAGTASDTIQIKSTAANITNAMDINVADTSIVRAGQIDNANATIAAAGILRAAQTDGGGSDCPACTVYVLARNVA